MAKKNDIILSKVITESWNCTILFIPRHMKSYTLIRCIINLSSTNDNGDIEFKEIELDFFKIASNSNDKWFITKTKEILKFKTI